MKQRLADYVADFLVSHGITDCGTYGRGKGCLENEIVFIW